VSSHHQLGVTTAAVLAVTSPTSEVALASAAGRLSFVRPGRLAPIGTTVVGSLGRVQEMHFSHDGAVLVVHSGDAGVRLLDVAPHVRLGEPIDLADEHEESVALRADGQALAVPLGDGVLVWDLRTREAHRAACAVAGRRLSADEAASYLSGAPGARAACRAELRSATRPGR